MKQLDAAIDRFLAETEALVPQPNLAYRPGSRRDGNRRTTGPLHSWVPKFCETESTANGLQVHANGRLPFLARTRLKGREKLEIRAVFKSNTDGKGRIQWRTAGQEAFPKEGQIVDFDVAAGSQSITVPFVSEDRLAHMRVHLPAGSTIEIERIDLWQMSEEPQRLFAWNFRSAAKGQQDPNQLSAAERKAGFELLFNGRDLEDWSHEGNWTVTEGVITRKGKGGSLVYGKQLIPDDFELRFQWKVAEGSNSGVYYRPTQYEYQILDNDVHRDGKNPRTSAASLYFCMAPSHDATRPVGEWNEGRIVCKGTVIQHWLNGEKVVGFDYTDPRWSFHVNLLNQRGGDLTARGAHLSLQDHGDPVWYRGIKLRELGPEDKLDRRPVEPAEISDEVLKAEAEKLRGILERRKRQEAREAK